MTIISRMESSESWADTDSNSSYDVFLIISRLLANEQ